jgi:hypothetical protein
MTDESVAMGIGWRQRCRKRDVASIDVMGREWRYLASAGLTIDSQQFSNKRASPKSF